MRFHFQPLQRDSLKKRLSKQRVALLIAGVILVWIFTGIFTDHTPTPYSQTENAALTAPIVKTTSSQAEPYQQTVALTAFTKGEREVTLLSKVQGDVLTIPVDEGQQVEAGQPLISIDVEDKEAKLEEAKAMLEQRQLEYKVAKSLSKSGYQSATEVAKAKASLKQAEAALVTAELDLKNTQVTAPFPAMVEYIYVELGETVDNNSSLVKLVNIDALKVTGHVHESLRRYIHNGSAVNISTADGDRISGNVSYVSAVADENTRTYLVEAVIKNNTQQIASGRTVTMEVPLKEVMAHKISPSWLSLNKNGDIGLKLLTQEKTARFYPVTIISENNDVMWVEGIPDQANIITFGQAFLKDGDKVRLQHNESNTGA